MADTRSIGQVLRVLQGDFPDISVSKIRYLEGEGLIAPERTPAGYRRFTDRDIERLRYILTVQRDHFLPLKVIREHLDKMDRGLAPPPLETPKPELSVTPAPAPTMRPARRLPEGDARLSRAELLQATGLPETMLAELERYRVIQTHRGSRFYNRDAVVIGLVARKFAEYGLDARHLRAFQQSASREVALVEQALAPHMRRAGSQKLTHEVVQWAAAAHAAMMRQSVNR